MELKDLPFPTTAALPAALIAMARSAAEPSAPYRVVQKRGYSVVRRSGRREAVDVGNKTAEREAAGALAVVAR